MNQLELGKKTMFGVRQLLAGCALLSALIAAPASHAALLDWALAGPGTSTVSTTNETTVFEYNGTGPLAYSGGAWSATATVADAGDYTFDWTYWGEHAFFATHAFLTASNGSAVETLLNFSPFDGFYMVGSYTFENVEAGDVLQFRFGGSNFDSNPLLLGVVSITQQSEVPEPASVLLLSLGALGIAATRRKRMTPSYPVRIC